VCSDVVSYGLLDRSGRLVSLRPVDGENRRAVADVTVSDDQRRFTAASGATEGDEVVVEIRCDVVRLGPPKT
jgi:hypothetical protein